MYEIFLSFMFGLLIGTGVYSFLEIYSLEFMIIPVWSGIVIGLFIYDKLFRRKSKKQGGEA